VVEINEFIEALCRLERCNGATPAEVAPSARKEATQEGGEAHQAQRISEQCPLNDEGEDEAPGRCHDSGGHCVGGGGNAGKANPERGRKVRDKRNLAVVSLSPSPLIITHRSIASDL